MMKLTLLFLLPFSLYAQNSISNNIALSDTIKQKQFLNRNSAHYFFAPSAYSLKKGEGYYQNTYLLLNSFNYGLTNHFTIGGGIIFNPTFKEWQSLFITPKVGFRINNHIGISIGSISNFFFNKPQVYVYDMFSPTLFTPQKREFRLNMQGILYMNTTIGNINNNLTVGICKPYTSGLPTTILQDTKLRHEFEFFKPIFNLSAMKKINNKVSFISENWLQFDGKVEGFLTNGVRVSKKKHSFDFGLMYPLNIDDDLKYVLIPYVDFSVQIGKK